jgi:hypothetical protein
MRNSQPDELVDFPPERPPEVIERWRRELDEERDQRLIARYSTYLDSGRLVRDHCALVHDQQLAHIAASRPVVVRRSWCVRSREQRARSTRRTNTVASSDDGPPAPEPPPKTGLNFEAIFPSVNDSVVGSGVVA